MALELESTKIKTWLEHVKSAKVMLNEAIHAEQKACLHEFLAEAHSTSIYSETRLCMTCGLCEDGGSDYLILTHKPHPELGLPTIMRDKQLKLHQGLWIKNRERTLLRRGEMTLSALIDEWLAEKNGPLTQT